MSGGEEEGQQEGNDGQETKNTSDTLYLELFIQQRTIFLDFALFGGGQRAGELLKPFVFRDATLSGSGKDTLVHSNMCALSVIYYRRCPT